MACPKESIDSVLCEETCVNILTCVEGYSEGTFKIQLKKPDASGEVSKLGKSCGSLYKREYHARTVVEDFGCPIEDRKDLPLSYVCDTTVVNSKHFSPLQCLDTR